MNETFTIEVTMKDRWIPQLLGLLREMETLGRIGSSRELRFYADGDGDFRPHFDWSASHDPSEPLEVEGILLWDAG